jgi:hypothetical protein
MVVGRAGCSGAGDILLAYDRILPLKSVSNLFIFLIFVIYLDCILNFHTVWESMTNLTSLTTTEACRKPPHARLARPLSVPPNLFGRAYARGGSSGPGVPTPPRAGAGVAHHARVAHGASRRSLGGASLPRCSRVRKRGRPRASCSGTSQLTQPLARCVLTRQSTWRALRSGARLPRAASGRERTAEPPTALSVRGPRSAASASTAGGWGGMRLMILTDERAVLVESKGERSRRRRPT